MTAVIGGGVGGLSAAYYALERGKLGPIVLMEASSRLGGWVNTKKLPDGTIFEQGPRMLRPAKQTLNLIDKLNLSDKLIVKTSKDVTTSNRFMYYNDKMYHLGGPSQGLFFPSEPYTRSILSCLIHDLKTKSVPQPNNDESLYSFVSRRYDKEIADYAFCPMMCGIVAGDAKEISVKFMFKDVFEWEQKYGSIFMGLIKGKYFGKAKKPEINFEQTPSVERANKERWSTYGIEGGLEELPKAIINHIRGRETEVWTKKKCEKITFSDSGVKVKVGGGEHSFKRLISALPAKDLAPLVQEQHPELAKELKNIGYVDVALVNLKFPAKATIYKGFGVLVPPIANIPILGIIFDSCLVPQKDTVLTVMMGGAWFNQYFGKNPSDDVLLKTAVDYARKILKISEDLTPEAQNVTVLRDCIPQPVVGHYARVEKIFKYINDRQLPLGLCGSSYDKGVGINDVILSAKEAVTKIT